jgi:hypothetical protein
MARFKRASIAVLVTVLVFSFFRVRRCFSSAALSSGF